MTDLIDAIDNAATALLERATSADKEGTEPTPLAERVKAFEAVAKWLDLRKKIAPEEKKEARIVELRERLNGTTRGRRTGRAPEATKGGPEAYPPTDVGPGSA